jgi:RNA polymerase sigma-70 factor (ECF subfamily)
MAGGTAPLSPRTAAPILHEESSSMPGDSRETRRLLRRVAAGEVGARGDLLLRHRHSLDRLVAARLHPRLLARVDPADVVQDVFLEAAAHLDDYLRRPVMPFALWLRSVAVHKLLSLHRRHLGAEMRDASREVPLPHGEWPAEPTAMARALIDRSPQPGEAAIQAEWKRRLHEILGSLPHRDRRILELRHFEQLSSVEAAGVLGIHERAASKRYLRALQRLRTALRRLGVDLRLVLP